MPMVLEVPKELEARVEWGSGRAAEPPDVFMIRAIAQRLEDMEDYEEAARVLAEVEAGRMKTYSLEEVERELDELDAMEG